MMLQIERRITVPTGDILVVRGERGPLECLSLGDYGKDVNLKADFMGLSREPDAVRHTRLLPLEEKWVVTISTQYGCSMGCQMCDVPKVGPGVNATAHDMIGQVEVILGLHPEVQSTKRLNVHFARMGEPTWNPSVLTTAHCLRDFYGHRMGVHPVVSTMMPRGNRNLSWLLGCWCDEVKNECYGGEAGLQLSINSTDDSERWHLFGGSAMELQEIGAIVRDLPAPEGRKYTLNFAVSGWRINPGVLLRYFDPDHWLVKLTPMHQTSAAEENGICTEGDYTTYAPYQAHEDALKEAGYDVLVFIASREEDGGLITCGNAVLSGSTPKVPYTETGMA